MSKFWCWLHKWVEIENFGIESLFRCSKCGKNQVRRLADHY